MATYELDYQCRISFRVDADTVKEAVAKCEQLIEEGAEWHSMNFAESPHNIEMLVDGKWRGCELPNCDDDEEEGEREGEGQEDD